MANSNGKISLARGKTGSKRACRMSECQGPGRNRHANRRIRAEHAPEIEPDERLEGWTWRQCTQAQPQRPEAKKRRLIEFTRPGIGRSNSMTRLWPNAVTAASLLSHAQIDVALRRRMGRACQRRLRHGSNGRRHDAIPAVDMHGLPSAGNHPVRFLRSTQNRSQTGLNSPSWV